MLKTEPSELDYSYKYMKRYIDRKNDFRAGASLMQPKTISKCITLIAAKKQRNTFIPDTGNMVDI